MSHIHNNNVPSLGLEQQHEQLCSNTPRVPYTISDDDRKVFSESNSSEEREQKSVVW